MKLIDTHCHPQMGEYDEDRMEMIRRSLEAGTGMIAIGTSLDDSLAGIKLAEQFPHDPVYAAIGVHPTDDDAAELNPLALAALVDSSKVVGVGETGLDYFRLAEDDGETRDIQADLFEQHILLAKEKNLPVIIHCRDVVGKFEAYDNVLTILNRHNLKNFVMHCYAGDWNYAQKFLDLGGMISETGILTFPKSDGLVEVVKNMPLDRLMVETDAPFLTPVPNRGKRNEPLFVAEVAKKIAEIRGVTFVEIAQQTTANAVRFFRLP